MRVVSVIDRIAYGKLLAASVPRLGHADPLAALQCLMEDRGLRLRDFVPAFGSSSGVSDVLRSKREISKQQAGKLAECFSVPTGLFV